MKTYAFATALLLGSAVAWPQGAVGDTVDDIHALVNGPSARLAREADAPIKNNDLSPEKIKEVLDKASKNAVKRQEDLSFEDLKEIIEGLGQQDATKRQEDLSPEEIEETIGALLGSLSLIISKVGKEVPDLKEPAKTLGDAISDFEDAAADAELPSASGS